MFDWPRLPFVGAAAWPHGKSCRGRACARSVARGFKPRPPFLCFNFDFLMHTAAYFKSQFVNKKKVTPAASMRRNLSARLRSETAACEGFSSEGLSERASQRARARVDFLPICLTQNQRQRSRFLSVLQPIKNRVLAVFVETFERLERRLTIRKSRRQVELRRVDSFALFVRLQQPDFRLRSSQQPQKKASKRSPFAPTQCDDRHRARFRLYAASSC